MGFEPHEVFVLGATQFGEAFGLGTFGLGTFGLGTFGLGALGLRTLGFVGFHQRQQARGVLGVGRRRSGRLGRGGRLRRSRGIGLGEQPGKLGFGLAGELVGIEHAGCRRRGAGDRDFGGRLQVETTVGAEIEVGEFDRGLGHRGRMVDDLHRAGFGEAVAQCDQARCERVAGRHAAARRGDRDHGVADPVGEFGDGGHAIGIDLAGRRQQPADIAFRRGQRIGDRRHFGHREGAIHRVDGAQQRLVGRGRRRLRACQPGIDRDQMTGDFGLQDLEQDRVDADLVAAVDGDRDFDGGGGHGGGFDRRGRRFDRCRGVDRLDRRDGRRGRGQHGHDLFAAGDAVGIGFQRAQVDAHHAIAAQRVVQLRQRRAGLVDHRHHGGRRRPQAVAHLVQHVLDLPAELAQRARADETAAALERVEDPADRLQQFDVVGIGLPRRQQLGEVADLLLEFLEEDFADLVVDVVAGGVEPGRDGGGCGSGRGRRRHGGDFGRRRCRRRDRFARRHEQRDERRRRGCRRFRCRGRGDIDRCRFFRREVDRGEIDRFDLDVLERDGDGLGDGFGFGDDGFGGSVLRRLDRSDRRDRGRFDRHRCFDGSGYFDHDGRFGDGGRFARRGQDRCGLDRRGHRALGRQRPVAQRFEAVAGDVEDLVAVGALFAQRFEVILDAGERVGERVELAAVRDAPAGQQFVFGVQPHAVQVLRRQRQVEHLQRTGHFAQQRRDRFQLGVVPRRLHERDESLAGGGEVADRLAHEHVEHLAGLGVGEVFLGVGAVAGGEARDLVVQRGVDVQQCAGDFQQCGLVGLALAVDDVLHRVALLLHEAAREAEAEHAEGVGHALQALGLRAQFGRVLLGGAQVEVELVLDPQQVFFDRRGHGVQQRAVAPGDAAAGVVEFGFGGLERVQLEHLAQLLQRRVVGFGVGDVEQQLARGLHRGIGARGAETALLEQAAALAVDAGEHLAQAGAGRQRAIAQSIGDQRGDPQHAALRIVGGAGQQRLDGEVQAFGIARQPGLGPRVERIAEAHEVRRDFVRARGRRQRRRARQRGRQRTIEVGVEQDAFAEAGLAARTAQLVEHRQQDDRDFLVAALQAFQVVRQQHHAAHQRGAGDVVVLDLAVAHRAGQLFHLLGHHGRGVQLDHAQGALHLVQQLGAHAHPAGVGRLVGETLDLDADQAQGLVELGFDPTQRAVFDRVVERGHRAPPGARPHPNSRWEVVGIICKSLRRCLATPGQAGSLKSATERRRSAASCARFPMDSAVWFAPWEVCAVID